MRKTCWSGGCDSRFARTKNAAARRYPIGHVSKFVLIFGSVLMCAAGLRAADAIPGAGLVLTFAADGGKDRDTVTVPNVSLYVESGKPPTPFLSNGQFTATWEGIVSADLRSDFSFQAELNGSLKIEINGTVALEASGSGGASLLSKPARLNKGANAFKATFNTPEKGDAFVRLSWTEKPPFTSPIPPTVFTHTANAELQKSAQLRAGRELFLEHRCIKCHDGKLGESGVPELKMDAPTFEGIGARRHYDWMARWILDPKSLRPTAQMPKLLHGPTAEKDAAAIAAYLASLKSGGEVKFSAVAYKTKQNEPKGREEPAPAIQAKPLYERLHCAGCHDAPDAKELDLKKISLKRIAEKFPSGKLAEFLRAPEAHFAWTRMPNFHLSTQEGKELEGWLFAAAPKREPPPISTPPDETMISKGRKLVQTRGCLNCHVLKLENEFRPPALASLQNRHLFKRNRPEGDCLGPKPLADYGFSVAEISALNALTASGFTSLSFHVPAEFAERQTRALNCNACHGQLEGFPALELLGGKLKPEWAARFIAGDIPHKIRFDLHPRGEPWLEARMPAFKSRARDLAIGLAAQHGFPPKSPPETPVDVELAKVGQKLVGKDGGFSCVSCHAVGPALAMEVFESEGINFTLSADRLLPDYYRRWFRNPLSIDPQTKMPAYFDEGKSPLTEILGGDAEKQISAVWEYLKLRDKMPAPKTGTE